MNNMPTPEEILTGLTGIANDYSLLAIIWHIIFLIFVVYLFIITLQYFN